MEISGVVLLHKEISKELNNYPSLMTNTCQNTIWMIYKSLVVVNIRNSSFPIHKLFVFDTLYFHSFTLKN